MVTATKEMTSTEELDFIASKNGGILEARKVVDYARNPKTALHSRFEWDDTLAAEKWRLEQAQNIIRMRIISLPADADSEKVIRVREYVSLTNERGEGEYRRIVDVMRNKKQRNQMLEDAKDELRAFQDKYNLLSELSEIFDVIKKYI